MDDSLNEFVPAQKGHTPANVREHIVHPWDDDVAAFGRILNRKLSLQL